MSEKVTPKIIDFTSRTKAKEASTSHGNVSTPDVKVGRNRMPRNFDYDRPELGVQIPSMKQMYDLSAITFFGQSIEELLSDRELMGDERTSGSTQYAIELLLLRAREDLIMESIADSTARELPIRDLIMHTLGRAEDFSDDNTDDYRQKLRNEVILDSRQMLGDHETGKILERFDLIKGAHRKPSVKNNLTPFRIIK